ncbi:hypothetical protein ACHHYP_06765, partial [Achlya hypogyna]
MDALALALDPANAAAVATSLAAVTVGATAYFCTGKRKHGDCRAPPKPMLKTTISGEVEEEPIHDTKRPRVATTRHISQRDISIAELLKQRAIAMPDKVVYTFLDDYGHESVNLTFGDLDRAARKVAATLQKDANLKKGDRVMLAY